MLAKIRSRFACCGFRGSAHSLKRSVQIPHPPDPSSANFVRLFYEFENVTPKHFYTSSSLSFYAIERCDKEEEERAAVYGQEAGLAEDY